VDKMHRIVKIFRATPNQRSPQQTASWLLYAMSLTRRNHLRTVLSVGLY